MLKAWLVWNNSPKIVAPKTRLEAIREISDRLSAEDSNRSFLLSQNFGE